MSIVFRADASYSIGAGHVMRCLVLAGALRDRGVKVSFLSCENEGNLCDLIAQRDFSVTRLRRCAQWQEDLEQVRASIDELTDRPNWLVVDHYALDARWEGALRSSVDRIMVIDDLADRTHDCDLLLDQNIVEQMHTRYADKVPRGCDLLLGPEYVLLQSVYSELHSQVQLREGPVRRILIFFGGGDTREITGRCLTAFMSFNRSDIHVDVVFVGNLSLDGAVWEQAQEHTNVHVHRNLPTLAPLMAEADLAIGGGGATTWERLCLGLPALVVTLAENQRPVADLLSKRGLIRWIGHENEVDDSVFAHAIGSVIEQGLDGGWSQRCMETIDGKGTYRVCAALTPMAL